MSRLITFGCSYTYGHGLQDCHIEPNIYGPSYSRLAWPSLLSNMLGVELVNCGKPGVSNLYILWNLLNFDFQENDLCVIMWTHYGRHPFTNLKYDSSIIDWDDFDSSVIKKLPALDAENIIIKNHMSMHHAYTHLLSKNIQQYFVIGSSDGLLYKQPKLKIPSLDYEITINKFQVDKALDNMHPGPQTHLAIAKELFNKINVIR